MEITKNRVSIIDRAMDVKGSNELKFVRWRELKENYFASKGMAVHKIINIIKSPQNFFCPGASRKPRRALNLRLTCKKCVDINASLFLKEGK